MRIKHLILPMFMTVMGMAFTSCKDDDMTCKDCKKEMAVTIDVVDANGMPMSRGTGDGVGYTVYGAGTYETTETPTVGATAKAGYKITKFDKWTEKNGLEVLVSKETKQVSDVAKGGLGNHSYTVTVEAEKKFTNTVKAGTGGSASGTYTGITDATHPISASPNSGYKFKNWTCQGGASVTNANSTSTTAIIGSSDGTITANFIRNAYNDLVFDIVVGERGDFEHQSGGQLSGNCVEFEVTDGIIKHTNDPKHGYYSLYADFTDSYTFPSVRLITNPGYSVVGWARDEQEAANGDFWPYCNDPCNLTADDVEAMARECPKFCLVVEYSRQPQNYIVYIEEQSFLIPNTYDFSNIHWNWFDPSDYDIVHVNKLVSDGGLEGVIKLYNSNDHNQYVEINHSWCPVPYNEIRRDDYGQGSFAVKYTDVVWCINGESFYLNESLLSGRFFANKISRTFTGSDNKTYTIKYR